MQRPAQCPLHLKRRSISQPSIITPESPRNFWKDAQGRLEMAPTSPPRIPSHRPRPLKAVQRPTQHPQHLKRRSTSQPRTPSPKGPAVPRGLHSCGEAGRAGASLSSCVHVQDAEVCRRYSFRRHRLPWQPVLESLALGQHLPCFLLFPAFSSFNLFAPSFFADPPNPQFSTTKPPFVVVAGHPCCFSFLSLLDVFLSCTPISSI